MSRVNTSELTGVALDRAVAMAVGMKAVSVGYEGTEDETPEQKNLPEWFDEATDKSVGDYFVNWDTREVYANGRNGFNTLWAPSTDWDQCGPLIEKYGVSIADGMGDKHGGWLACVSDIVSAIEIGGFGEECGDTPLIAACRAIVSANLGDEVDAL